jgi:regulator of protease activity HflC (stomatin/prohibitin superfamily)
MKMKVRKPAGFTKIQQFEKGVQLRWGKTKRVLDPGLWSILPFADEVRVFDMRPQDYDVTFETLSRDNYPILSTVNIRYKVFDVEAATGKAPENPEAYMNVMLRSKMGNDVYKKMKATDVPKNRDLIGSDVVGFLNDSVKDWGLEVEMVQLKDVKLPQMIPDLEQEIYKTGKRKRVELIKADTDSQTLKKRAGAEIEMLGNYYNIVSDFAEKIAQKYGAKEGRDVLYIMLGNNLGFDHPVTQKIRMKMRGEGVGEGAAGAAEVVGSDPKFTYYLSALTDMKGLNIFDHTSYGSLNERLKELDNQLLSKLYPK